MSVRDAALMMNVLKRPDARDWTSLPADDHDYLAHLDHGIHGMKIAYSPALGFAQGIDAEVAAAVRAAVQQLQALGAHVDEVDPGIDDPLDITIGLWFMGAWTLWNTRGGEQQAVADPDFAVEAREGSKYSALDIQRLTLARGALGSHMRQFMQRYDLLVTPAVAVPAFDARPAGAQPLTPQNMLGWTPFSIQPDAAAGLQHPLRAHEVRVADRPAVRRPDVRRCTGAARGTGLRDDPADRAAEARLLITRPHPPPRRLRRASAACRRAGWPPRRSRPCRAWPRRAPSARPSGRP
jgi:hypothetical protein